MANEQRAIVSLSETALIARAVRQWLNGYADKPYKKVDFEHLNVDDGLALSTVQGTKTRQFITGKYEAEYQFRIVYRVITTTIDERLKADEALNAFGVWCENSTPPTLGNGLRSRRVRVNSAATLYARYDNNAEDHTITLTLTYEVI